MHLSVCLDLASGRHVLSSPKSLHILISNPQRLNGHFRSRFNRISRFLNFRKNEISQKKFIIGWGHVRAFKHVNGMVVLALLEVEEDRSNNF